MDTFSVVGIISLFLVFQSLLLFLFLLTVKSDNKLGNRLLATYFLIFAFHISVFFYSKYIELPLVIERLRDQIMFLSSPLLYLYLVSSVYSDFKLKGKHIFHLLPFIIAISIFVPRFYAVNNDSRLIFLHDFHNTIESKMTSIFAALTVLFYLILMFRALYNYKRVLDRNYSNKKHFNYKWLFQLTVLLSVIFIISEIKQIYVYFGTDLEVLNLIRAFLTTLVLIFLTWIVFKSLFNPKLFRNIDTKHLLSTNLMPESRVDHDLTQKIMDLKKFMTSGEPYLDASLTLNDLAVKTSLRPRELSILINQELNINFFEFINEYRIERAKSLLNETNSNKLSVQQIMYKSGFNSKSSFYTEFKKHTNSTPSQYKKQQIS